VPSEYLNIKEAATYLGVAAQTLRRWDTDGKLKATRHPVSGYRLYRRADLDSLRPEYQALPTNWTNVFVTMQAQIQGNKDLRDPQREAYCTVQKHFTSSIDPCIVQIPVGCGKTGLISILPFGISKGRVLVITPNLTIRNVVCDALDIASPNCFWTRTNVLVPTEQGPFFAVLDGVDANLHDCNESHFVVANIQQLASSADRWLPQCPPDYFDMIIVDEGHHNAASSWQKVFDRFPNAKVVSLTATPFRQDQRRLTGETIYRYPFAQAMMRGYIKHIHSVNLAPEEIFFTYKGDLKRHTLAEVLKLKDEQWFNKGVALSLECNKHIVEASIQSRNKLQTTTGFPHQIIGVACSIDHANQIVEIFNSCGVKAAQIHSQLPEEEQEEILNNLRSNRIECIVQVMMLGEGFDHPPLSIAAVFRPFRSLSPFIQFIGRIMRVIRHNAPGHKDNRGYIVSHIGLNNSEHWDDFMELDTADQQVFKEWLTTVGTTPSDESEGEGTPRRFDEVMQVQNEIINSFITQSYLDPSNDKLIETLLDQPSGAMGFTLRRLGVTKERMKEVLKQNVDSPEPVPHQSISLTPQRERLLTKTRLYQRGRSVATRVLRDLGIGINGFHLSKMDRTVVGRTNFIAIQELMQREINDALGIQSGGRGEVSGQKLKEVFEVLDDLGDRLVGKYKKKENIDA